MIFQAIQCYSYQHSEDYRGDVAVRHMDQLDYKKPILKMIYRLQLKQYYPLIHCLSIDVRSCLLCRFMCSSGH